MSTDALGRASHLLPAEERLATEVRALAELLADVVEVAGGRAVYPSRWDQIAELALEHKCVRVALQQAGGSARLADTPPLSTEHIVASSTSSAAALPEER